MPLIFLTFKGDDYVQKKEMGKTKPFATYHLKIKSFGRWCCSAPNVEVRRNTIRFTNDTAFEHIAPAAPEVAPASDGGTITMEIRRPARPGRRMVPSRHGWPCVKTTRAMVPTVNVRDLQMRTRREMDLAEERNRSEIGIAERKAASDAENARISALADAKRIEAETENARISALAEAERIRAEAKKTEAEAEKTRADIIIAERKSSMEAEKDRLGIPAIPQRHAMANIRTKLELARDMGFSESGMEALRVEYSGFFGIARVDVAPPPQAPIQPPIVVVVPSPPPPPPPQQDRAPVSQVAPRTYHQMRVSDFLVPQGVGAVQPQQIPPAVVRARPIGTFVLETWLSLQGKDDMSHGRLSVFGKRVSKAYRERHGGISPKKRGAWNAYTDADSDMIEEIYRTMRP